MIDNYEFTMALIKNMEDHLPIPAEPTKNFVHAMRKNGIKVKSNQKLQIESLTYLGDEGGISCCIGILKQGKVVITSLTHIRVKNSHPLGKDITKYQQMRIKALASQNLKHKFHKYD
jgi:hypothetical protein